MVSKHARGCQLATGVLPADSLLTAPSHTLTQSWMLCLADPFHTSLHLEANMAAAPPPSATLPLAQMSSAQLFHRDGLHSIFALSLIHI